MLRKREMLVSEGNSNQARQSIEEPPRHTISVSQTHSLLSNTPELLPWTGHPTSNMRNFQGENLPGVFISEELWNNGLGSVVVIAWEANCYFSWWSWLTEAWDEKISIAFLWRMCSASGQGWRRGLFLVWCLFFLSAAMTSATAAAICFCNCSLKASGKKAVLIVQITVQLITGTVPRNLCNHLTELSN